MRNLYLFFIILTLHFSCSAQELVFAKKIIPIQTNNANINLIGNVINKQGDFFVAGTYGSDNNILIDTLVLTATSTSSWYETNSFLIKYNQLGELTDEFHNTGTGIFALEQMTIDTNGNIYLMAHSQGQVEFGGVSVTTNIGIYSYFILKLDSNLNLVWHKVLHNNFASGGYDITARLIKCDKNNELLLVGSAHNSYNLDGFNLVNTNGKPFISKLDPLTGIALWVTQINGNYSCVAGNLHITNDENNDIILTGNFGSSVTLGNYIIFNNTDTLSTIHPFETFLAKFTSLGNYVWAKRIDTIYPSYPTGITSDLNNNIFITNNGLYKFNSNGILQWENKLINGSMLLTATSKLNNYFVVGFSDSMEYNSQKFYATGSRKVLIKVDTLNGSIIWNSKLYKFNANNLFVTKNGTISLIGNQYGSLLLDKISLFHNDTVMGYMLCFNDKDYYATSGNSIKGNIYDDVNINCTLDSDSGISSFGVVAFPGPTYGVSDSVGNYELKVGIGNFTVKQITPIGHAIKNSQTCGVNSHTSSFTSLGNTDSAKNFPNLYNQCFFIKAYIDRSMIPSPCIDSGKTYIAIENLGLDTVFNIIAKVKYPGIVINPLYSIPAWSSYSTIDSVITYNINYIAPQSYYSAVIYDTIDCFFITLNPHYVFKLRTEPLNSCYPGDSISNFDSFVSTITYPINNKDLIKRNNGFKIYPNPSNSVINIENIGQDYDIGEINIFNMLGQKVIQQKFNEFKISSKTKLNISDLVEGSYILQITSNKSGRIFITKFTKE